MDVDRFLERCPVLYHVAHGDAWPGLQRHGLLSAAALVRLFERSDADSLLAERRPRSVDLSHVEHGSAVLRDHGPLNEAKLAGALTGGMTVPEWLRQLNDLVFFFPDEAGRDKMVKKYGHEPLVVLTVRTLTLVREYEGSIRLAPINTGAVLYDAAPRGRDTIASIRRFDPKKPVREVAVLDGVPNLSDHLWKAERWLPDGTKERLFQGGDNDHRRELSLLFDDL